MFFGYVNMIFALSWWNQNIIFDSLVTWESCQIPINEGNQVVIPWPDGNPKSGEEEEE